MPLHESHSSHYIGLFFYTRTCVYARARARVCTNVLINYSPSRPSLARRYSLIPRMTNRRQVLLNNQPVLREVTYLARQKLLSFLARRDISLNPLPLLNTNYFFGFSREPRHDRVIYQRVERHKGICAFWIFMFRQHVFVVLSRDGRKRKRSQ